MTTTAAEKDDVMARSDVKDTVKHAGAVLSQSTKEIAATAREQATPVSEAVSAAVSAAADAAAERGREAQKIGKMRAAEIQAQSKKRAAELQAQSKKRAAELQKQAAKAAKKSSKKARSRANRKAQKWADLAAQKTGRKPKRRKGRILAVLGGGVLAGYAVVTVRKKQAQQQAPEGPRTPDTDPV
jgi:colicin import membrane protein